MYVTEAEFSKTLGQSFFRIFLQVIEKYIDYKESREITMRHTMRTYIKKERE